MSDEQKIEEKKDSSGNDTQKEFENDLELLEKKNQEYLSGWQRAKADYLNLKKESEKKSQDLIKFANAGLIMEILPVLDNFKLAVQHIPEEHKKLDWVAGIMHIKNQLENILNNFGIEEIKTVGEKFNPEFHEAVPAGTRGFDADSGRDAMPRVLEEEGVITKELRAGYTMNGKVIQAAKVVVG
ncbi:MAG: nucleotide exchange factor GrpE [bacterium]